MDLDSALVVAGAFFFAAFVKGVTGLGFMTTCLPILAATIGLKTALPLVIVPSLSSNLIVMTQAGHFRETVRRFWPLFLAAAPGLAAGLTLLVWIEQAEAAAVLGLVLVAYVAFAFANPHLALPARLERPLAPLVGLLTGTVNGLTGSQVMPVLPYLLALKLDPNRFVQAINCSFTFSSLIMAAGLTQVGLMTLETAVASVLGIVPVYLGIKAGRLFGQYLSPAMFRNLVLALLLILGLGLAAQGFL